MDAWYEEGAQVYAHACDPYVRVEMLPSSRYVRVVLGGQTIAETHRPRLMLETGLPMRYYLPGQDVRVERLTGSSTTTRCPLQRPGSVLVSQGWGERLQRYRVELP
jgi:uncharacterized protein (DUF427 family)